MSLRKKVLGIALAGALLGAAGAAYGERIRADEPPAQSAPAAPVRPRVQAPPAVRQHAPQPRAPSQTPPAPKQPDTRAYQPPAKPRVEQPPRARQRLPEETPGYHPGTARPPVVAPQAPRTNDHYRPEHRWPPRSHPQYREWNDCRYDPWWRSHWHVDWWDVDLRIWAGWPYWGVWGWDHHPSYRVYEESGTLRTFEIMPPPGYDSAIVAYLRNPHERTVRVELAKELPDGGLELTVLRDRGADGDLEEAIAVEGRTRDEAQARYLDARERSEYRVPQRQADSLYGFLWEEIRGRL